MRHLILDTNGIILKKRNRCFWVCHKKKGNRIISPFKVKSIVVIAECLVSTAAVKLSIHHEIPVFYANRTGDIIAKMVSKSYKGNAMLRIKQFHWSQTKNAREWVKRLLEEKLYQQNKMLRSRKLPIEISKYNTSIDDNSFFNTIRVEEAQFGKKYWDTFRNGLPDPAAMKSRNQRPATDIVNSLLNYFYGFLYTLTEQAIWANGLDPYIAVFHKIKYNEPVLCFDIIEPFRPVVDGFVLDIVSKGVVKGYHINTTSDHSVSISKSGKKALIPLFLSRMERKVQLMGKTHTWYKQIYRLSYLLKQEIEKSKPE